MAHLPIQTLNVLVANAWLPSLPWSAANALAIHPAAAWIACALLAIESFHGWRRVWTANLPPPTLDDPQAHADDAGEDRDNSASRGPEIFARDVGKTATHPAALAAADDRDAGADGWRRRLRDRLLSAAERRLAVPGNFTATAWFPGTLRAALFGILAIGIAALAGHLDTLDLPSGLSPTIRSLRFIAILSLCSWGLALAWPGRQSAFSWLMDPVARFGTRALPCFAAFPFSLRGWLRAAAKEWCLRSLWIGALFVALASLISLMPGQDLLKTPVAGRVALSAFSWLMLLSLFPLYVIHRVSLAASGAMFRLHGASRVIPSLVFALVSPAACAIAALAAAGRDPALAMQASAIAIACAALSLRLALARGENRCLDLHG